ncbi:MAG: WecB/TagA/CpsF family glycosyltransferase [Limnoraphis sp. WC205]|jgi:exopolysaccharide biosynthesis WecB/TagA/CpsF family protein|nr:WecB/TagA/CpsF family glycosyltransferase [Limnoraphis sp. WC205]
MIDLGKYNLLGIKVNAIDYESAVNQVMNAAKNQQSMIVAAQPVHGIMTAVLDKAYRYRLNRFDLVCPDGQPVRWALNLLYKTNLKDRVYGPNLTLYICEKAAQQDTGIFLYGSTPKVLEKLESNLIQKFPTLKICGSISPPYRPLTIEEDAAFIQQIQTSEARIVFVGLGCPRQETWAFEHRDLLNCPILCVGAAFDFHAGNIPQAPSWMQRGGLEWAFRLWQEPKRLWKRYVFLNPLYLILLFLQLIRVLPIEKWSK